MAYNSRQDGKLNSDKNVIKGGGKKQIKPGEKPMATDGEPSQTQETKPAEPTPKPKPGTKAPVDYKPSAPGARWSVNQGKEVNPTAPGFVKAGQTAAPPDYKPSKPGARWSLNQGKEVMGKPQPAPQTNTPGPAPVEGKPVVPQGGVQDVAANAPAGGAAPQQNNYDLSPTGQAAAKGMSGGSSVPQGPQVGGNMAPPQGGTTSMSNPGGQQGWTQDQMNNATPMGQSTGGNQMINMDARINPDGTVVGRGPDNKFPNYTGPGGPNPGYGPPGGGPDAMMKPTGPQLPQWAQQQGKTNDQYMDYLKANPQAAGNQNAGWQQLIQQRDMFNRFNPGGPMNPNPQQPPTQQPPLSYADIGNKPGVIAGPDGKPMMDPKFQPPAGAQPGGNMAPNPMNGQPGMGGGMQWPGPFGGGPGGNMRPPFMPPWMPGPQGPMGGMPPQGPGGMPGGGQFPGGIPPQWLMMQQYATQFNNPQQQMNPLSPFPGMR